VAARQVSVRLPGMVDDGPQRREFWAQQMDEATTFMQEIMGYPVGERGEACVSLEVAAAAAGVDVAFSELPHANGADRIYFLREGLVSNFLGVAREMNARGWVLLVEDAYRTRDMQAALGRRPVLFEAILAKVVWESQQPSSSSGGSSSGGSSGGGGSSSGSELDPEQLAALLIRRVAALIAAAPKVGTHMSGSAIDISVLDASTREEIDRGAPCKCLRESPIQYLDEPEMLTDA
jgi:D-alanyl-D-alanine dipeptidase